MLKPDTYSLTNFQDAERIIEEYNGLLLKYAITIDNEVPPIINIHEDDSMPNREYPDWWNNSVTDHIRKKQSIHKNITTGKHTLRSMDG